MKAAHNKCVLHHRREILLGCLRCGGLLALGGLATALGWRSLHGHCLRAHPCAGCPVYAGCDLPKAREAKTMTAPATGAPLPSRHV
jgi:hypothetical protein